MLSCSAWNSLWKCPAETSGQNNIWPTCPTSAPGLEQSGATQKQTFAWLKLLAEMED